MAPLSSSKLSHSTAGSPRSHPRCRSRAGRSTASAGRRISAGKPYRASCASRRLARIARSNRPFAQSRNRIIFASTRRPYEDTSRRTKELLGAGWGCGLYFNYLFTGVWIVDVIWWWRGLAMYRRRPRWIQAGVHAFFAFMFFNATVVFAAGPVRWLGLAATMALVFVGWRIGLATAGSRRPMK